MNGILVIDKPPGITSHDVVSQIRRKFNIRRVGHAGTLDPLATGVLIILVGKSTKLFDRFVMFDKTYEATMILGVRTTTSDIEGEVLERLPYEHIGPQQCEEVLKDFTGEIQQIPPMYSAIKFKGKKLYQLARSGIEVQRQPRAISIHCLRMSSFSPPDVRFYLECSKGTYVRQLAEDVGRSLGCGACISEIKRLRVGPFSIEQAITLKDINESHIRPWQA